MTLRIRTTSAFRGPSIWSTNPVICVDLGSNPIDIDVSSDTREALIEALQHSKLERATDVTIAPQAVPDSANPIEWAGWLAVAVQRLCGVPVEQSFCRSNQFAFDCLHARVGRAAAYLAVRLLNHELFGSEPAFDFEREMARLTNLNRSNDHGPVGRAFAAAARRRGIPLSVVDPRARIVELGDGWYRQRILGTMTSRTAALGDLISKNKLLTNRFLAEAGLPVPAAALARNIDEARERAARIGYPVVLKPSDQADSHLVFVDIRDEAELRARFEAITRALRTPARFLVLEQFVRGSVYCALIVGDQVIGVFQRVPAHVIGDGTSTIQQLIERENADPRRQRAELRPIQIEDESLLALTRQELTLDSIPAASRRVELKPQIGHKRDGGLARECTGELHPDSARLLIQATRTIGLDVSSIDFVTPDCSVPLVEDGGAIIEVNAAPDFERHLRPSTGIPRDGAAALIDMLFPPGMPVRVPIVAVHGGAEAALVVERIASMLAATGKSVGVVANSKLTVDGLALGEHASNYQAARRALNHPMVEVAVLETPAAEIVEHGLPFDRCDVAVITAASDIELPGLWSPEQVLTQVAAACIERPVPKTARSANPAQHEPIESIALEAVGLLGSSHAAADS